MKFSVVSPSTAPLLAVITEQQPTWQQLAWTMSCPRRWRFRLCWSTSIGLGLGRLWSFQRDIHMLAGTMVTIRFEFDSTCYSTDTYYYCCVSACILQTRWIRAARSNQANN